MLLLSKLMSDSMVVWEIPNFSTSLQPGLAVPSKSWYTCWKARRKELVLQHDSINLGTFGMNGTRLCTSYRM
jgi:hypothetical protein